MDGAKSNQDSNFRGQHANEEVLCFTRKHGIVILPQVVGVFLVPLMIAGLLFLKNSLALTGGPDAFMQILGFIAVIGFTYFIHRIYVSIFGYYLKITIVTNQRIIELDKTLILRDSRDAVDLLQVQDTVMEQNGFFHTVLNYGDITISMPAVNVEKRLKCLPNPDYYFRKINASRRQALLLQQQRLRGGIVEKAPQATTPIATTEISEKFISNANGGGDSNANANGGHS